MSLISRCIFLISCFTVGFGLLTSSCCFSFKFICRSVSFCPLVLFKWEVIEINLPLVAALSVFHRVVGDTSPVSRNSYMSSFILDTMARSLNIHELNFHRVFRFFLATCRGIEI